MVHINNSFLSGEVIRVCMSYKLFVVFVAMINIKCIRVRFICCKLSVNKLIKWEQNYCCRVKYTYNVKLFYFFMAT